MSSGIAGASGQQTERPHSAHGGQPSALVPVAGFVGRWPTTPHALEHIQRVGNLAQLCGSFGAQHAVVDRLVPDFGAAEVVGEQLWRIGWSAAVTFDRRANSTVHRQALVFEKAFVGDFLREHVLEAIQRIGHHPQLLNDAGVFQTLERPTRIAATLGSRGICRVHSRPMNDATRRQSRPDGRADRAASEDAWTLSGDADPVTGDDRPSVAVYDTPSRSPCRFLEEERIARSFVQLSREIVRGHDAEYRWMGVRARSAARFERSARSASDCGSGQALSCGNIADMQRQIAHVFQRLTRRVIRPRPISRSRRVAGGAHTT